MILNVLGRCGGGAQCIRPTDESTQLLNVNASVRIGDDQLLHTVLGHDLPVRLENRHPAERLVIVADDVLISAFDIS